MKQAGAEGSYTRRVLITAGIAAVFLTLVVFLWRTAHVLLVFFAAILLAVLLDGLRALVQRVVSIPRLVALSLVIGVFATALAAFGWVIGPRVANQVSELVTRIPTAIDHIGALLREQTWGRVLLETLPDPSRIMPPATGILAPISGVFSSALGALTNMAIIVVVGVYLAVEPGPYTNGALRLLPIRARNRGDEVLQALRHALQWWLMGRVVSMGAVGVLTTLGLWLIDVRLALALGLIAGLLSFVPYLGPILSAIPAILVALVDSPVQAVYVVFVYGAVQFLEGNLITPIVQERAVSLPPAVLLMAQLAMAVSFGLMGVLLATPFAVVAIALIQMLYIRDTLGDPIAVLGEHGHRAQG
ncbi:AI-2E family transporter [Arhodomonas sp. AD133]|uniref:AI-2E family transporter n=1 Tax=Arhodomonas sp. AD133 TaxID=3415009 RepID=UPI003EB89A8D